MPRAWLSAIAIAVAAAVALPAGAALAQPKAANDAPQAGDAGLQRRVEQLEEQLVDMQVLVGTLESLARGGAPVPSGGQPSGGAPALSVSDAGRLDALETQIRALAAQLENLQEEMRNLAGQRSGTPAGGFGAVTVAPAESAAKAPKDALDRVFPGSSSTPPPRAAGFVADDTPPQQLYERAYGYLLQKDYDTAEAAFDAFLKRHPDHQLAGNAQYWLGETFYVRGQYRPAAAAYLKGYQDYAKSQKAPESLLKLAMSLRRLGQKDAACSSYTEFEAKFPDAPAHVTKRAKTERQRSGC